MPLTQIVITREEDGDYRLIEFTKHGVKDSNKIRDEQKLLNTIEQFLYDLEPPAWGQRELDL